MQPSEPGSASVGSLSGNARAGIAVLCIGFGLFICAAAARWIDVQPAPGVPHWLVGLAGAIFVLAGIAVALPQRPTRVQDFVGALLFAAFAAMGLWIGFGPGDRRFNESFLWPYRRRREQRNCWSSDVWGHGRSCCGDCALRLAARIPPSCCSQPECVRRSSRSARLPAVGCNDGLADCRSRARAPALLAL